MTTLKAYLEAIDYKINEGSDYGWNCYGPNARYLDSNRNDQYSISAIFDSVDQTVYSIEAWDYKNNRTYRWVNPDFDKKFRKESKKRGIDPDESFDGQKYIIVEVAEDILEKISAIVAGNDYDTRIQVPLDLDDEMLYNLMTLAHKRDITLNALVEEILLEEIEKAKDMQRNYCED